LKESTGLIFVLLPGGTFQMGACRPGEGRDEDQPNVDAGAEKEESPIHTVTLAPFFLSKYEMTQGQWQRIVGRNPSMYLPGSRYGDKTVTWLDPVEQVSWNDCNKWIGRLGLLLPTEAQWEYGNRAGTTTPMWCGSKKESLASTANVA